MNHALGRAQLDPMTLLWEVEARYPVQAARPGHIPTTKVEATGECFPMVVADMEPECGVVPVVGQAVGQTMRKTMAQPVGPMSSTSPARSARRAMSGNPTALSSRAVA